MDPYTGENERGGFIPDALPADQRQALPVIALPDGWERTSRNAPAPAARARSSSTATAP